MLVRCRPQQEKGEEERKWCGRWSYDGWNSLVPCNDKASWSLKIKKALPSGTWNAFTIPNDRVDEKGAWVVVVCRLCPLMHTGWTVPQMFPILSYHTHAALCCIAVMDLLWKRAPSFVSERHWREPVIHSPPPDTVWPLLTQGRGDSAAKG